MDPLTVSFNAKTALAYQPVNAGAFSETATDKKNYLPPWAKPGIAKDQSSQFVSALAHEIRNPLANINLSVGILQSAIKDDELKTYLDIIIRSSIRINHLINDLLQYQEADEMLAETHSVHQLLDEVLEMTGDRIMLKNIAVRRIYAAQDCRVVMNRPEMKIALTNIIINAIDAMDLEKRELKLVTKSIRGKFLITIEDNGCGISKSNLKNIFKPYFTTKPGGLGVGLGATYVILQSNQVEVKVESEAGRGTRFILYFNNNRP